MVHLGGSHDFYKETRKQRKLIHRKRMKQTHRGEQKEAQERQRECAGIFPDHSVLTRIQVRLLYKRVEIYSGLKEIEVYGLPWWRSG